MARIRQTVIDECRLRLSQAQGLRQIARELGIARSTVSRIASGELLKGSDDPGPKPCPTCGFTVQQPCQICRARRFVRLILKRDLRRRNGAHDTKAQREEKRVAALEREIALSRGPDPLRLELHPPQRQRYLPLFCRKRREAAEAAASRTAEPAEKRTRGPLTPQQLSDALDPNS